MERLIRQSANHSRNETQSLLQAIFASELVAPSKIFWLTSPWISDIPILDNRALTFDLGTNWGPIRVPLSKVLVEMAKRGCKVRITTTTDSKNNSFLSRLTIEKIDQGVGDNLMWTFDDDEQLHEKALLGDDFCVFGSMNFTFFGLQIRRELLKFQIDPAKVAELRFGMRDDFGGVND
jgi:hypothetical protein